MGLVLRRKEGESIRVSGPATITILGIGRSFVRVDVEAVAETKILRGELEDRKLPVEPLPPITKPLDHPNNELGVGDA